MNLAQFLVMMFNLISNGFEYVVLRGNSICLSLFKQASLVSCQLMFLNS